MSQEEEKAATEDRGKNTQTRHVRARMHKQIDRHAHIDTHKCRDTHAHKMHAHKHVHTHTHTHTHTHIQSHLNLVCPLPLEKTQKITPHTYTLHRPCIHRGV